MAQSGCGGVDLLIGKLVLRALLWGEELLEGLLQGGAQSGFEGC